MPEDVGVVRLGAREVRLQQALGGDLAAAVLARRPERAASTIDQVAEWLRRWHRGTVRREPLTRARLEREVLGPAAAVAAELADGGAYVAALAERCARLEGREAPLVAAHNDLTMWNLLLDPGGGLGVVDWESAEEAALPFKDLLYATADAAAAADSRYGDRLGAVRTCFAPGGARAAATARLRAALATELGATPELEQLCWHACWLGHAANEATATGRRGPRPFLEIVRWVAATELRPPMRS